LTFLLVSGGVAVPYFGAGLGPVAGEAEHLQVAKVVGAAVHAGYFVVNR
jgi:hypothetical protein